MEKQTPVPGNKTVILSYKTTKQNIINLIAEYLAEAKINVKHAGDEGDADVVIIQVSLQVALENTRLVVIADDINVNFVTVLSSQNVM